MTSRREFLQTTALAGALPFVARTVFANLASRDRLLVFDERFPAARQFGARAGASGWSARPIQGDVTPLWANELVHRWTDGPLPVAGLTAPPALFCLEELARDHRMRVVFHVEHLVRLGGHVAHTVRIPEPGLGISKLDMAGEHWPELMVDHLAGVPVEGQKARGPSRASMPAAGREGEMVLASWVIAPVPSAARSISRTSGESARSPEVINYAFAPRRQPG